MPACRRIRDEEEDPKKIQAVYLHYLAQRHGTYMTLETGQQTQLVSDDLKEEEQEIAEVMDESAEGYSAVALNVIEALTISPKVMILNVPNRGALVGMADDDVVETTVLVGNGVVQAFCDGFFAGCRPGFDEIGESL